MPLIDTRVDGDIGTIILDHLERRNALSRQLVNAVVETLQRFSHEGVRVVVLRAQPGVKVWSAGHDVDELPEGGRDPLGWDDPLRYLRAIEVEQSAGVRDGLEVLAFGTTDTNLRVSGLSARRCDRQLAVNLLSRYA